MSKLYAIGNCMGAIPYFQHLADEFVVVPIKLTSTSLLETMKKDSVLLLGGGEDISPVTYSGKACQYNMGPESPSVRDTLEFQAVDIARASGAFVVGICRGAQILGIHMGYPLFQHVINHNQAHPIVKTNYKLSGNFPKWTTAVSATSVHHQMVNFDPPSYKEFVLYQTGSPLSSSYFVNDNNIVNREDMPTCDPEIFFNSWSRYLGIQGHPEFTSMESQYAKLCMTVAKDLQAYTQGK